VTASHHLHVLQEEFLPSDSFILSQSFLFLGTEKSLEVTDQKNKEVVEGQELNALLRTTESTKQHEMVHCRDGSAMFLWSTFPAVFFIQHPSHLRTSS
jgi:hypothetical protein